MLIKEKRLGRFSPLDFIKRFQAVRRNRERIDKSKTPQGFFASGLKRANPSSAQDFFAYSIKEKRRRGFSTLDLQEQIQAVVVRGTSMHRSLPYFCCTKIRACFANVRHGVRAVH